MQQKEVLLIVGVLVVGLFLFTKYNSITGQQVSPPKPLPYNGGCYCAAGEITISDCPGGGTTIRQCVSKCPGNYWYQNGVSEVVIECSYDPALLKIPRGSFINSYPFGSGVNRLF